MTYHTSPFIYQKWLHRFSLQFENYVRGLSVSFESDFDQEASIRNRNIRFINSYALFINERAIINTNANNLRLPLWGKESSLNLSLQGRHLNVMASQFTGNRIFCSTACSAPKQWKHQSSAFPFHCAENLSAINWFLTSAAGRFLVMTSTLNIPVLVPTQISPCLRLCWKHNRD